MLSSLPLEIWFSILDQLPRSDQLRISQVSHHLCAIARKIIYGDVDLRSDNGAVKATVALLARDYSVARNVRRLYIHTAIEATQESTWFDAEVFAGMTNLCQLDLIGMPFSTKEDEIKFNNSVSESLHALKKLKYLNPYTIFELLTPFPKHKPVLQIRGLQEITWVDPDTFIYPLNVFTPINASRETLTHICIPVATDYTAPNESLIQFFTLRFPHLSTLEFGGWNTVTPVGTALTNFLVAHPLIEHLTLGFADPNGWEVHCHVFPNASLGPSTLPNLRCLSVDASNLGTFVRSGMFSLQSLESLHIGVGYFKEEEDGGFANMYQALEAYGGLPGLKLLELELEGIINELGVARWILDLGKLFPKLEQFWGDYEVGKAAVQNPDIFASYTNVKSLVLPNTHLRDLAKNRINHVKQLAARNASVMDLQFYNHVDIIIFRYCIERDTDGGITAMVELLEDGTENILI